MLATSALFLMNTSALQTLLSKSYLCWKGALNSNQPSSKSCFCRFWATVCKTTRLMLSVYCLSVLSVCDVGVLWPNGWTDQDETRHAGRPRPWPHCVRWDPAPPSPKEAHLTMLNDIWHRYLACGSPWPWPYPRPSSFVMVIGESSRSQY